MLCEGLNTIPEPRKGRDGCIHSSLQACTLQNPAWCFLFLLILEWSHPSQKASTSTGPPPPWRKGREKGANSTCAGHIEVSFKGGALSLQQWGQQGKRPQLGRTVGCLGLPGALWLQGAARPSFSPGPSTALWLQSLPFHSLWSLTSPPAPAPPLALALVSAAMRWASSASTSGSVSAFLIVCCSFCSASSSSSCRCRAFSSHCGTAV